MSAITAGVYKITFKPDGRVYIGQSKNIHKRWNGHRSYGTTYEIMQLMREHGRESFDFEVLELCEDDEKRHALEIEYMKQYKSFSIDKGFNKRMEHCDWDGEQISGKKISHRRTELNMGVDELAEKIGVQSLRVDQYEGDYAEVSALSAHRIADVLNCDVEDLLKEDAHEKSKSA